MQGKVLLTSAPLLASSASSTQLPVDDDILDAPVCKRLISSNSRRSLPTDIGEFTTLENSTFDVDRIQSSKDDAFPLPVRNCGMSNGRTIKSVRSISETTGNDTVNSSKILNNGRIVNKLKNDIDIDRRKFQEASASSKASNMHADVKDLTKKTNRKVENCLVTSSSSTISSSAFQNPSQNSSRKSSVPTPLVAVDGTCPAAPSSFSSTSLPVSTTALPGSSSNLPSTPSVKGDEATDAYAGGSMKESQEEDRCLTPPVPKGTTPLSHQVAGHIFGRENGQKKNKHGFLQSSDSAILKPLQSGGKGERELLFYQKVFSENCSLPDAISMRQFIPQYLDEWTTPEHPGMKYLKLADLTKPFSHPSIMDVKIGPVTYDEEADEDKIRREKSKFPYLEITGYQLVGIKVYQGREEGYKTIDRKFLRALDDKTILTEGLSSYFRPVHEPLRSLLLDAFIRRIDAIEAWFMKQRTFKVIASSLLFIYDGQSLSEFTSALPSTDDEKKTPYPIPLANHSDCNKTGPSLLANEKMDNICQPAVDSLSSDVGVINEERGLDSLVELRMIDFTHVFDTNAQDDNYLIGLRSLREHLRQLKS